MPKYYQLLLTTNAGPLKTAEMTVALDLMFTYDALLSSW